ncbi:MAG: diaminopimelate epimerase [SAR324 cluster bacterium]|nr:diaminopimelate epimerase [SAR324 cluster bacterium]
MSNYIPFVKMQGAGNDYIYLNLIDAQVSKNLMLCNFSELAKYLSNRHFSIGADGLVLIGESSKADFSMTMFNADGSESEMCGNAIRCVAKYVHDHNLTNETIISIETKAGVKRIELFTEGGLAHSARVNMGVPVFEAEKIPSLLKGEQIFEKFVEFGELALNINLCNMGNPHCVIYTDNVDKVPLEQCGPTIEQSSIFPNRINVEFVEVLSDHKVKQRTWERGSGETLACGTGASAVAAVGIHSNRLKSPVKVQLIGGDLIIEWAGMGQALYMTGPAVETYSGEFLFPKDI